MKAFKTCPQDYSFMRKTSRPFGHSPTQQCDQLPSWGSEPARDHNRNLSR